MDEMSLAGILGFMGAGPNMMGTAGGPVPGMGQVDLGQGYAGIPGMEQFMNPAVGAGAAAAQLEGPATKGAGINPTQAALGLKASQAIAEMGKPRVQPAPASGGIAPRATGVKLDTPQQAGAIDPTIALSMAKLLYGAGGR